MAWAFVHNLSDKVVEDLKESNEADKGSRFIFFAYEYNIASPLVYTLRKLGMSLSCHIHLVYNIFTAQQKGKNP